MRFNIQALSFHCFRPFFSLLLCAMTVMVLSSSLTSAEAGYPDFEAGTAVDNLPEQLAGYELFTADSRDGWAYLTFVQWSGDGQGQILAFQIGLGEFDETSGGWQIYAEGTAAYMNALPRLPQWLQWLAKMEGQRDRNQAAVGSGTFSIQGLPWEPNTAWRYNQGPVTAGHLDAFDFGVPEMGVEDEVYAAEDGIVIGTNGTCIIIERPSDGLRHFYQHINNSDLWEFSFGELITYKQYIGRTTTVPGCGGTSTGHHVHFAFYTPYGGPIINPQGFFMNGWEVIGNTLVKGDQVATANFMDPVYHDGITFFDDFNESGLASEWFWVREDDANWSLDERPDFLRIYTQNGTLKQDLLLSENLLLRPAVRANHELVAGFEGTFSENFHEATLVLYTDDDNYLFLSRVYDDINFGGDVYIFGREENGALVDPVYSAVAAETTTELRLLVSDSFVMGLFLNEAGEWAALGQIAIDGVNTYTHLGLSAYHGVGPMPVPGTVVDFDFVLGRPLEVGRTYLPHIQRES